MPEALVVRRETHRFPRHPPQCRSLDRRGILRWMGREAGTKAESGGLYLVNDGRAFC